jgi:uncharacterized protein (DUF952 family)
MSAIDETQFIYHMCDEEQWAEAVKAGQYVPPTFAQDGFIHATAEPNALLPVANHFYLKSKGDWICLKIDPAKLLTSKVVYEAPAPVGETEAFDHAKDDGEQPKFPHIYGPIWPDSVVAFHKIMRNKDDGTFLSIEGIC